jgi:hypothetical protein
VSLFIRVLFALELRCRSDDLGAVGEGRIGSGSRSNQAQSRVGLEV